MKKKVEDIIILKELCDEKEDLFKKIDNIGGFPIGYKYLTMIHGYSPLSCYFNNVSLRNEMNTTILTADDYYIWKLSDSGRSKLKREAREELLSEIRSIV
jgi:hypothetical protein